MLFLKQALIPMTSEIIYQVRHIWYTFFQANIWTNIALHIFLKIKYRL